MGFLISEKVEVKGIVFCLIIAKCRPVFYYKCLDVYFFILFFAGVITKPDLVDRGSEQQLIDTIMNKKYQLKKGYVCVRCRGQDALMRGVTLEQAFAAEEKFFATEAHFK